jgi:hypothetical protein
MGAQGQVFQEYQGDHKQVGLDVGDDLFAVVVRAQVSCKTKLGKISENRSSISVADMFEMQMLMNHFSQLCEMCTNVVAASNGASLSMIRNFKQ